MTESREEILGSHARTIEFDREELEPDQYQDKDKQAGRLQPDFLPCKEEHGEECEHDCRNGMQAG
jgi:hypothetical protein